MSQNSSSMQTNNVQPIDPMDWLFGEIYGLFGNQFLDKFRSGHIVDGKDTGIENMKAIWATKIRENGLKLSDIKRGLKGCERCKFGAPSWPDFLELCRPTPNVDEALTEAIAQLHARQEGKDEWSHPAIYHAAMKVGYFEMTTLSHSALRPRFETALKKALDGPLVPVPPKFAELAAPAPVQQTIEIADVKAKIAEVRDMTMFPSGSTGNGKRWAEQILERNKRGDKSVSLLQVQFAREALRMPL